MRSKASLAQLRVPTQMVTTELLDDPWRLDWSIANIAYEALALAAADDLGRDLATDALVVAGCVVFALVLGATTLRRRTA